MCDHCNPLRNTFLIDLAAKPESQEITLKFSPAVWDRLKAWRDRSCCLRRLSGFIQGQVLALLALVDGK